MPDNTDIDDIALAWMCDQLEGLLAFDTDAAERILFSPSSDSSPSPSTTWALGTNVDLMKIMLPLFLNVAGGSHARTPGQYRKDLRAEEERAAPRDFATNESVHPCVRHRVEGFARAAVPYKPVPFFPPQQQSSSHGLSQQQPAPQWRWEESMNRGGEPDGLGAKWVRPGVPACDGGGGGGVGGWLLLPSSALWWWWERKQSRPRQQQQQRSVVLHEWVVREMDGRYNFEARLLPWMVKEQLWARNRRLLKQPDEEGAFDEKHGCRLFWTRSNWGARKVVEAGKCRVHGDAPIVAVRALRGDERLEVGGRGDGAPEAVRGDERPGAVRRERVTVRNVHAEEDEPVVPKDVGASTSRWTPDHEGTIFEGGPVGGTSLNIVDEEL